MLTATCCARHNGLRLNGASAMSAGFSGPDVVIVPDGRTIVRTVDDVVAHTLSMHSTAPHLFGDQLSRFEADLRQTLADAASPAGAFSVRLPDNKLNVWKPGP